MKQNRYALISILLLACLLAGPAWVNAAAPAPHINPISPLPPAGITPPAGASAAPASTSALNLPPLKAVLIVGPIDGDTGSWTLSEIANMQLAETELKAHGVTVSTFYTPNNDWTQIKAAAAGAQFLFYRGHGVNWGGTPLVVGGFDLKNKFVSSDDIRADLKLAPNAIVMLYGCYTAGSEGGVYNLSSAEAQRRVAQYSDPFLDIGAAGYYADWFGDAFKAFTASLFSGSTLGQAYSAFYDTNAATVEKYTHPAYPQLAMWLDKDNWGGIVYNDAFVGRPNETLETLFATSMVAAPKPVIYVATPLMPARAQTVSVTGTTSLAFTWHASFTSPVSWASLSATSGAAGQSTTVTLNPAGLTKGTYTTALHLTTASPGVLDADQTIPVSLVVADKLYSSYIPISK